MELYQSGEARRIIAGLPVVSSVGSRTDKQGSLVDDPPEPPPEKKIPSTPC
jgi:hypothetical protein